VPRLLPVGLTCHRTSKRCSTRGSSGYEGSTASGVTKALDRLEEGDTLVVWKLDRLGRSLLDLITIVKNLEDRGVNFRSLTEGFDTTTNGGRLVFQIMGALAEYERNLIRERTRAGLAAAKAAGHRGGPKFKLRDRDLEWLVRNWEAKPVDEIAAELGIGPATAYRAYHRAKAQQVAADN
jgi:DNA invertase Pin-like site-specific DNA recombinase